MIKIHGLAFSPSHSYTHLFLYLDFSFTLKNFREKKKWGNKHHIIDLHPGT